MKRRQFLGLAAAAAALPHLALAQQRKVPLIISLSSSVTDLIKQNLIKGLADFGYVDGRNIRLEFFIAPTIQAMPRVAAQAVVSNPDVIVTSASPAPLAVKGLTSTIPTVFSVADPVAIGLVPNLYRPGGNLTGTASGWTPSIPKQIGLLKEVVPDLTRLAVFGLPTDPPFPVQRVLVMTAAQSLGIETLVLEAVEGADLVPLFEKAKNWGAQAAYVIYVRYFGTLAPTFGELCLRYKLPAMCGNINFPRNGLLLGYSGVGYATRSRMPAAPRSGICRSGRRPGSSWCSTRRRRPSSASPCRKPCSPAPMR